MWVYCSLNIQFLHCLTSQSSHSTIEPLFQDCLSTKTFSKAVINQAIDSCSFPKRTIKKHNVTFKHPQNKDVLQ